MQFKRLFFIVSTLSGLVSLSVIFLLVNALPVTAKVVPTKIKKIVVAVHLKIPKINVDTTLESVGLTPEGAVDVPKGPINAAWFNLGPRPGMQGSAVIVGHFGMWKKGIPGVFNNLNKLHAGDKLFVQEGSGAAVVFVVRDVRLYSEDGDAADIFGAADNGAHLNLITCNGEWNPTTKSYSHRLVVFADKI